MEHGSNAGSLTGQLGEYATGAIDDLSNTVSGAVANPGATVNANLGSIGTSLLGQALNVGTLTLPGAALGLFGRGIDSYRSAVQADEDLATMGVYGTGRNGKDLSTSAWNAFFGNPAANQAKDIANTYFADATDPNSENDTAPPGTAGVTGVTSVTDLGPTGYLSQTLSPPTATSKGSFYSKGPSKDDLGRISRENDLQIEIEEEDRANREAADVAADEAADAYAQDQAAMAAATDAANAAAYSYADGSTADGGYGGGTGWSGCYVTTALAEENAITPAMKRRAVVWCLNTQHDTLRGRIWRTGYHRWGKPFGKLIRKSNTFKKFMKWSYKHFLNHKTGQKFYPVGALLCYLWIDALSYALGWFKIEKPDNKTPPATDYDTSQDWAECKAYAGNWSSKAKKEGINLRFSKIIDKDNKITLEGK